MRPRNVNETVTIQFTTTKQMGKKLDALVHAGLYGKNRSEVAERALCERIRALIKEGLIAKSPIELP